jgi:transcription elongation factor GreA
MVDEKITLTVEGKEKLNQELKKLVNVTRPEVIEQLKAARSQGDLSENADYDAARNRQAEVEARIAEIENILATARVEKNKGKNDVITIGKKITVKYTNDGKEATYTIVGTVEADPFNNKISPSSPIGIALLNKSVGDKVAYKVNESQYEVEILKVQ